MTWTARSLVTATLSSCVLACIVCACGNDLDLPPHADMDRERVRGAPVSPIGRAPDQPPAPPVPTTPAPPVPGAPDAGGGNVDLGGGNTGLPDQNTGSIGSREETSANDDLGLGADEDDLSDFGDEDEPGGGGDVGSGDFGGEPDVGGAPGDDVRLLDGGGVDFDL